MPSAEFGPGAVQSNGLLYVAGGVSTVCCTEQNTLQAYDASTNTWTTKASMPTARAFLSVGNVNGVLYAVGGLGQAGVLNVVEAYDPRTDTWTTKAPMPTAREELAVRVIGGTLYAVGGYAPSGARRGDNQTLLPLNVVEAYNPATNSWSTKMPMHNAHGGPAAVVANRKLYVIGGIDAHNAYGGSVEAYDPATNAWTTKAPMLTPRYDLAAGNVKGKIYAIGGWGSSGVSNAMEAYDPLANVWTSKAPMPTARYGLVVRDPDQAVQALYALGGRDGNQNALSTVEAYTP